MKERKGKSGLTTSVRTAIPWAMFRPTPEEEHARSVTRMIDVVRSARNLRDIFTGIQFSSKAGEQSRSSVLLRWEREDEALPPGPERRLHGCRERRLGLVATLLIALSDVSVKLYARSARSLLPKGSRGGHRRAGWDSVGSFFSAHCPG